MLRNVLFFCGIIVLCSAHGENEPTCAGRWTLYYNQGVPDAGEDDIESLDAIRTAKPEDGICEHPLSIDARVNSTFLDYSTSGETVEVGASFGLICKASDQDDGECEDYTVRYCCPQEPEEPSCEGYWTNFINRDTPDNGGYDDESLQSIRESHPDVCECPIAIDARLTNNMPYTESGETVNIGPSFGLTCKNDEQKDGACEDYKVRFCCKHEEKMKYCPGVWSRFIDRDDPDQEDDNESLSKIRQQYPKLCKHPTGFEARLVDSDMDYTASDDVVTVGTSYGLTCLNADQKNGRQCEDYKIRFCCPKPLKRHYCSGVWTKFFNHDNPNDGYDDESLESIRENRRICRHPTAVDARLVDGNRDYTTSGNQVTVGASFGLTCKNSEQMNGQNCENYKVRFCCPRKQRVHVPRCHGHWTQFISRDTPSGQFDNESLYRIRESYRVCKRPSAIDARLKNGDNYRNSADVIIIGALYGLTCRNSDQKDHQCDDYKVRFCCPYKRGNGRGRHNGNGRNNGRGRHNGNGRNNGRGRHNGNGRNNGRGRHNGNGRNNGRGRHNGNGRNNGRGRNNGNNGRGRNNGRSRNNGRGGK